MAVTVSYFAWGPENLKIHSTSLIEKAYIYRKIKGVCSQLYTYSFFLIYVVIEMFGSLVQLGHSCKAKTKERNIMQKMVTVTTMMLLVVATPPRQVKVGGQIKEDEVEMSIIVSESNSSMELTLLEKIFEILFIGQSVGPATIEGILS